MKIKYAIIEKFNTLSAKEMDLLLYAVERQNQRTGCVNGIYYRDVMKHTGMCKQSFYNALKGLCRKGIIAITRRTGMDYDIRIIGNVFPDKQSYHEGYVKLNRKAFTTRRFKELKAHEKYLLLEFMKGTHENGHSIRIGVQKLREKFQKILGVSERVLRGYLHSLRAFFSIGIKDGMYYITYLHSVFADNMFTKSEYRHWLDHEVETECRRNHISCEDEKEIADTSEIMHTYCGWLPGGRDAVVTLILRSIAKSAEGVERKKRRLSAKYVHKLLKEMLPCCE